MTLRAPGERHAYLAGSVLYMAGIFVLSSLSFGEAGERSFLDRWASNLFHMPLFAGLAWLVLQYFRHGSAPPRTDGAVLWRSFAAVAAYAVFDEIHQAFIPGRTADPLDIVTDVLGACFALAAFRFWEGGRIHSMRGLAALSALLVCGMTNAALAS